MNVLQVNTVYPFGSTGRITAEIAAYTAAQADDHAYVAFGIGEPARQERLTAVRIGNPLERKFHGAIRMLLDAEGYGSYFATGQLIKLCKGNNVDVVHLHNLHGCYLNLKRWFRYLQKSGVPVVWTLHDCWPLTGHCAHFDDCGCEKWQTLCFECPQQKSYPECVGIDGSKRNYRLKKKLFRSLDRLTIVLPCRWMRGIAENSFLKEIQIRVIYNGVDTRQFKPIASDLRAKYGLEKQKIVLAVASIWNDQKGLKTLRQLSQMLNGDYRIVILGLTKEQIGALPQSIIGLERTAEPMLLRAWYGAADCFVNPTFEDTMPLVNLEALACGTPVVTFNTGGCPEAVTEACGLVVEKGDLQGLADAVMQICDSGVDYSQACIEQAKRFDAENTVRAYDALYREVAR
ncbi:MAG: glycosyltransferase [Bacillota bacterium]